MAKWSKKEEPVEEPSKPEAVVIVPGPKPGDVLVPEPHIE